MSYRTETFPLINTSNDDYSQEPISRCISDFINCKFVHVQVKPRRSDSITRFRLLNYYICKSNKIASNFHDHCPSMVSFYNINDLVSDLLLFPFKNDPLWNTINLLYSLVPLADN